MRLARIIPGHTPCWVDCTNCTAVANRLLPRHDPTCFYRRHHLGKNDASVPDFPSSLIPFDDLAGDEIAQSRVITFMEERTAPAFAIDGLAFVEGVVNQTVKLGTAEEWTIRNESDEWNPFHIHVNDFQIMTTNGQPVAPHFKDTSLLPPNGEIVIRSRSLDYTGKFVYHCHILAHEDAGMMGVVEVVE